MHDIVASVLFILELKCISEIWIIDTMFMKPCCHISATGCFQKPRRRHKILAYVLSNRIIRTPGMKVTFALNQLKRTGIFEILIIPYLKQQSDMLAH